MVTNFSIVSAELDLSDIIGHLPGPVPNGGVNVRASSQSKDGFFRRPFVSGFSVFGKRSFCLPSQGTFN